MKQNRGRRASTPSEIPAKGWKDIALRVKSEVAEDRVGFVAAAVAFYLLLGMVPMIGAFVALYGLVSDPAEATRHVESMKGVLPGDVVSVIDGEILRIAENQPKPRGDRGAHVADDLGEFAKE